MTSRVATARPVSWVFMGFILRWFWTLSFRDAPTELGSTRVRQFRRPSRQQPTWMRGPGIMVAKNHFAGAGSVGAAGRVASGALAGVASVAAAGAASSFLAEAIREVALCPLAPFVQRAPALEPEPGA